MPQIFLRHDVFVHLIDAFLEEYQLPSKAQTRVSVQLELSEPELITVRLRDAL